MSSRGLKRSIPVLVAAVLLAGLVGVQGSGVRAGGREDRSIDFDGDLFADEGGSSRKSDRGFLGVSVQRLRNRIRDAFDIPDNIDGLLVSNVVDDSPAEEAGIEDKDVIIRFNGKTVDDSGDFTRMIRGAGAGSEATVTVWRDGKSLDLKARLASTSDRRRNRWSWSFGGDDDGDDGDFLVQIPSFNRHHNPLIANWGGHGRLGVHLQEMNDDIASYFSAPDGRGALIWKVLEDSPAEKAGLKAGDVIVEVEGRAVRDVEDLQDTLRDHEPDETVAISYLRRGKSNSVKVTLDEGDGYFLSRSRLPRRIRIDKEDADRAMERFEREMERLQQRLGRLQNELQDLKD